MHYPAALLGGGVRRQPQLGGVPHRLLDGELTVHYVVLRNNPDPRARRGIDFLAGQHHRARAGPGETGEGADQRRLARTGGPDDGGVSQTINVHNHDANAGGQAQLEVSLQGVTTNTHQVTI